jgi:hypothetical protein
MLRPTVSRSVCLGVKPHLGFKTRFLLLSGQLRIRWYGAPSLTGGRVCRLQLLPVLASAVILGSQSRETHYQILLSQVRNSPNVEGHFPVVISPRKRVAQKSKLYYDQRSVGQYLLVSSTHLGPNTRFLLSSDCCGFDDVGHLLWREDGSVIYNCCWPLPTQSFSGSSPERLMTIFYCLRFETPPTWKARSLYLYPPGTGWSICIPRHWVTFSSPPTTHRTTVEVFEPASTWVVRVFGSGIAACLWSCYLATGVFAKPFPSNGCLCWLPSSCLLLLCCSVPLSHCMKLSSHEDMQQAQIF